jgi:hypothetical protein
MAEIRLQYRWVPSALEPLPSLTHEGPWCPGRSVPTGYKLEQRSRCRVQWASALDNQHGNVISKRKGPTHTHHVVDNGLIMVSGMGMVVKPGRLRRPASRLRGLTTIPIPELWAAMVVMPRYAYDEKDFTEQSPLDSAHISCRPSALDQSVDADHCARRNDQGALRGILALETGGKNEKRRTVRWVLPHFYFRVVTA